MGGSAIIPIIAALTSQLCYTLQYIIQFDRQHDLSRVIAQPIALTIVFHSSSGKLFLQPALLAPQDPDVDDFLYVSSEYTGTHYFKYVM